MKLINEAIRLEFDGAGRILRLEEPASGRNYLAAGGCDLFRLTLVETEDGSVLPGELRLLPETAEEVRVTKKDHAICFDFLRLDGLDLSVRTEVRPNGEQAEWRLSVENHTKFAVKQLEYPWFIFRTPLGNMQETERILVPKMDGILLGNPSLHPWLKNADGSVGERFWYPGQGKQWPKQLCSQMTAYYDAEGGLLVYSADPDGHPKRLGPVLLDETRFDLAPVHLRPEVGGQSFALEYPVITRFFKGDWQDAALAYKEWAQTTPWCARKVSERKDIPDWVKQGAFFFNFRLRYQNGGEAFLDDVPKFVRRWQEKVKMPMIAMMTGWEKVGEWAGPDYFPPYGGDERFRKMCEKLKADGNRAFTFGLSGLKLLIRRHVPKSGHQPELAVDYDARKKFKEEYLPHAALDQNGVPMTESNLDAWDGVHAYACPATEQAMTQLCGASLKLLGDYGVAIQQADQVLGGGTTDCYSKEHGHPPGRGRWQVDALKTIYDETRRRCKDIDPDFILSQEWMSEPYIQHLDIYHTRNYDRPQGGLEGVPLFSFLYHDYIPCYAGDWTSFLPTNESGVHFHGWNFVTGNLPAGSPLDMLDEMKNHPPEDADPKILEMAAHACAAFRNSTHYLVEGEMLKTAELDVPRIRMTIKGLDFGTPRPEIELPAVLHRFWKAPDESVACALANISKEVQTVVLPAKAYTMAKTVLVERNGEMAETVVVQDDGALSLVLRPRDAVLVRF